MNDKIRQLLCPDIEAPDFRYVQRFCHNGKSYWHDGRMLIEFDDPTIEQPPSPTARVPNVQPVLADIPKDGYTALQVSLESLAVDGDKWRTNVVCDQCGGKGLQICDLGHDHDCEECGGDGNYIGSTPEATEEIVINGKCFARFYVYLVALLPGVEVATYHAFGRLSKMAFRFDGGRGVLMGLDEQ